MRITAGGVARNIAHNLAKLDCNVSLLSVVGQDANGDMLIAQTKAAGVDVSRVQRVPGPSGTYLAILNHTGELVTAVNDMRSVTVEMIVKHKAAIASAELVIADCNLDIECLRELDCKKLIVEPVSVPKSKRLLELLLNREVFLATPNLDQVEALTSTRDPERAAKILHALGLKNIVIHAGSKGAYVSDGAKISHVPSHSKSIVDVTGAGDAAIAGLVFGLSQNLSLEKSAVLGQEMAARVIASQASTLE